MPYEVLFSIVGLLSFVGWGALLLSPLIPTWSDRIAGWGVPVLLSVVYVMVSIVAPPDEGGFDSFDAVSTLFTFPGAVLAGWIHFLAFDLVIGAWMVRTARRRSISFWLVLPCLPVVFLLGPAGLLVFAGVVAAVEAARWRSRGSRGGVAAGPE